MGISVSVPEMATAWKGLCDFATLAFVYQTFENITTNYSTNKENNMMKKVIRNKSQVIKKSKAKSKKRVIKKVVCSKNLLDFME